MSASAEPLVMHMHNHQRGWLVHGNVLTMHFPQSSLANLSYQSRLYFWGFIGLSKKRPLYSKAWCLVCVLKNVWNLAKCFRTCRNGGGGISAADLRIFRYFGLVEMRVVKCFRTCRNGGGYFGGRFEGISDLLKWGYLRTCRNGGGGILAADLRVFRTCRNEGISNQSISRPKYPPPPHFGLRTATKYPQWDVTLERPLYREVEISSSYCRMKPVWCTKFVPILLDILEMKSKTITTVVDLLSLKRPKEEFLFTYYV